METRWQNVRGCISQRYCKHFYIKGNLIIWKYCGEICLQREHKNGNISRAAQRSINVNEYFNLLKLFLKVFHVDITPNIAE